MLSAIEMTVPHQPSSMLLELLPPQDNLVHVSVCVWEANIKAIPFELLSHKYGNPLFLPESFLNVN